MLHEPKSWLLLVGVSGRLKQRTGGGKGICIAACLVSRRAKKVDHLSDRSCTHAAT